MESAWLSKRRFLSKGLLARARCRADLPSATSSGLLRLHEGCSSLA